MVPGVTEINGRWASVEREVVAAGVAPAALLANLHQHVVEQAVAPKRKRSGVIQSGPSVSYRTVR